MIETVLENIYSSLISGFDEIISYSGNNAMQNKGRQQYGACEK